MNTTVINFKTDKTVKEEAQRIAGEMGLNLSDVMNVCLRDFVKRRELNISLEIPTDKTLKRIKAAMREVKDGKTSPSLR
ncbi:MAG: type II toxin-antitoxin system RelB/DinJ family antitoxin [Minisyncoccales bacterium]